jgi:thiol-disulfide isomerase/thioredoxin
MRFEIYTVSMLVFAVLTLLLVCIWLARRSHPTPVRTGAFGIVGRLWALCLLVVVVLSVNAKVKGAFGTAMAQPAPEVQLTVADGRQLALRDLRGNVVLLDFWATWCPPCAKTRPLIGRVQQRFANDGLRVIGVSADGNESSWRRFIEQHQGPAFDCRDERHAVQDAFGIKGQLPTYVLIDRNGIERHRFVGLTPVTEAQLQREIAKLL